MAAKLALYTLILTTAACNFTGYSESQAPVIQPGVTAKTERQPSDSHARQSIPAATSAHAAPCPDNEVARLIIASDFERARAILEEDLSRTQNDGQRSCILTTMGMLAALPDSSLYDPEQALDYQNLARVNGVVKNGSLALQILDNSLANLIALQQQMHVLESDNDRLKAQLDAKDEALRKLKKLTLGNH